MSTIGKLSFNACIYSIWKERYNSRFVDRSMRMDMIVESIIFDVQNRIRGVKTMHEDGSLFQHIASNWELELSDTIRFLSFARGKNLQLTYGRYLVMDL